jgi:hypothetical protein
VASQRREGAKKNLFAAWRLCEKKKIACEKSKKEKRTKDKKRYGAPQCCGPGSKGAEAQRNKEGPHKDAKVQRKNPLRLGAFARKK